MFPKSLKRGRMLENVEIFDFELTDTDVSLITGLNRDERTGPDPDEMNWVPARRSAFGRPGSARRPMPRRLVQEPLTHHGGLAELRGQFDSLMVNAGLFGMFAQIVHQPP